MVPVYGVSLAIADLPLFAFFPYDALALLAKVTEREGSTWADFRCDELDFLFLVLPVLATDFTSLV